MLTHGVARDRIPRRRVALAAAVAFAMASVRGRDTKTGPVPNPRAVSLFQMQGGVLARSLERNFYGPGNHQGALQVSNDGILYKPTDSRDHLATPFLNLPFAFWQKRSLLIELAVPAKDAKAENMVITVQQDGFYDVATLTPDPIETVSGTWSEKVPIPRLASKIRLIIRSADEKETHVPTKIAIWYENPPLPPALVWMAGLIAVSACVLIWLMRQRATKATQRIT